MAREIKTIVSLRTFIRETAGLRRKGLQTVPAKEAKRIHMDGALKPKWTILIKRENQSEHVKEKFERG